LEINASDWHAWSNLGLACEWLDRKQEADPAYREEQSRLEALLKVRGDDPELQAELGLLYSRQGLREKAMPLIEAALARSPDDPNILSTAAEAYENFSDRSTALELVKKALPGLDSGTTRERAQFPKTAPGFSLLRNHSRLGKSLQPCPAAALTGRPA